MMKMKNISLISSVLFFLLSVSAATAVDCSNPIVYNNIGFPITNCGFPGSMCQFSVSTSNSQNPITNYTLHVQNINSVTQTVVLQPSQNLANYVSQVTIVVPAQTTLFFNMAFWTGGQNIFGPSYTIDVTNNCGSGTNPSLISIPLEITGTNIFGNPTQPMPPLSYTSGSSVTTSTTTTTTTTLPNGATLIFNQNGCSYSDIKCPSSYSSCSYQFTRNGVTFPTLVSCDSFNVKNNPGNLNSGQSMCPFYDTGGFANTITCTVIGYGGGSSSTTTTTTPQTTSTTTTSSTTTTTSSTTTTTQPGSTTLFDSQGCTVGSLVCPSNYQSCSYKLTKNSAIYPPLISCDSFNVQTNPGTLSSGQSVCPSYDSSKGYASSIRCQLFGSSSSSTSTTTTTSQSSTTTTTPSTTTTTTQSSGATTVFSHLGCNFQQIQCPSNYNHCTYQFTKNGAIYPPLISCDSFNVQTNPGTLAPGKSMCPSSTNGFATSINCTVVGYTS
jgi:hypothetical protein